MMRKKRVRSSAESTRKARLHRLFQEYQDDNQYIRIDLVTGNKVIFSYAGYKIDFIRHEGQITRGDASSRYLSQEDWVFLFKLAEELMNAVISGYKCKNEKRKKVKKIKLFPGQKELIL